MCCDFLDVFGFILLSSEQMLRLQPGSNKASLTSPDLPYRLLKADAPKLCKRIFDFLVQSWLGYGMVFLLQTWGILFLLGFKADDAFILL